MSITPDRRLLGAVGLWTLVALGVAAWPPLWPVLAGTALVALALLVLDVGAWRREPAVAVERVVPERAHVGREGRIELVVANPALRPVSVDLFEAVPADLQPTRLEFHRVVAPARGQARVGYAIRPRERGDRPLGPVVALARSPLGLLRRRSEGGADARVRVYPDTTRFLRPEALDPKRVLAALGVKPSRRRGEGMEFESLRDFVPGDDPRRLDWAASARRGRPVVRRFQHERNHTVVVALDASRLMASRVDGRTKLDHAVDASLALAYAALLSGDRVALTVFDRDVRGFLAPRGHRRELGRFVDFLRTVHPRLVEANFEALVRSLTLRQRGRALVVVLTDFVEVDAVALTRSMGVLGRHHRVLLVAVRDPLFGELDTRGPHRGGAADDPYRRIVLDDLLREREAALLTLRRLGLHTLDLPPEQLTAPILNRYLEIRYGPER